MLILALDTTTRRGSLAVTCDGHLLASATGDASQTHAERLPESIRAILEPLGRRPDDVTLFAVAAGPGSFTGLRIGIATIQGLAFALGRPVLAVSALDALAVVACEWWARCPERGATSGHGACVAACVDAHRQEVFTSLWAATDPVGTAAEARVPADPMASLVWLEPASVGRPTDVMARWSRLVDGRHVVVAGDGALECAGLLTPAVPHLHIVPGRPLLAPAVARLAAARAGSAGPPHAVRPVYVRRSDAELARDRRVRPDAVRSGPRRSHP